VVDKETCNACGLCAQYCPDGVIDRELNIDLDYCKGCGVCANECPKQAITMVREER
jgi:pyruvate ferredoxin oxidoreductase delta subunit